MIDTSARRMMHFTSSNRYPQTGQCPKEEGARSQRWLLGSGLPRKSLRMICQT